MLFAIKIYDKPDSGPLRDISRRAHLDYLRTFEAQTLFGFGRAFNEISR
jgi:uncharacterized protein YciI